MKTETVIRVLIFLTCAALGYLAADARLAGQAQATAMKSVPAQGYTPESWVLGADAGDRVLLCAAPKFDGTVACKTAGEFRVWVRQRGQAGK